jgi:hypothetical protein
MMINDKKGDQFAPEPAESACLIDVCIKKMDATTLHSNPMTTHPKAETHDKRRNRKYRGSPGSRATAYDAGATRRKAQSPSRAFPIREISIKTQAGVNGANRNAATTLFPPCGTIAVPPRLLV